MTETKRRKDIQWFKAQIERLQRMEPSQVQTEVIRFFELELRKLQGVAR
jgi:hypothetical protein